MFDCSCCSFGYLITTLLLIVFVYFYIFVDCNILLFLYDKFGPPISKLKGKVVWITGASSGIGESLAYILASNGVKLALSGTNQNKLEQVKKQCLANGCLKEDDVIIIKFDISDFSSHEKHLNTVLSHFKRLDILVNNAGRSQRALFRDIELTVDKEMFDINVFGLVNLTRLVLRYFLDNRIKGHFVVTSSIAGKLGVPNSATYTATKHALHGYFESLRTETFNQGIRVTLACPGPVFSKIVERAFTGESGKTYNGFHSEKNRRMATSRCAHLMAVSMVNQLDEVWITIQPVLIMTYASQYLPTIFRTIFPRFYTPERFARMREGN